MLKTQQRFKNERLNVFIEEISKIALSSNDENYVHMKPLKILYVRKEKLNIII